MNRIVAEWLAKAEADHASALRELRARKNPNYDSACFHAQQCVEKYLKGILQLWCIPFPKTHDLTTLLDACLERRREWEMHRNDLRMLTQFAVVFRYPGESATKAEAREAVRAAERLLEVLQTVVPSLGKAVGT